MIYLVLPAYNEAETIGALLQSVKDVLEEEKIEYKVIVVNDGSADATADVATSFIERMPLELITNTQNMGLGETVKRGLIHAAELADERDVVIAMDADNTHNPGLILRMARMIKEGNDVIIASRYREGSRVMGVPWHRRLMSSGMRYLFRIFHPIPGVRDYSCGYRAYRASLLKKALAKFGDELVSQKGFSCMVDILLKLHRLGAIMNEVPMILRYDLKDSRSKMDVLKTIKDTLKLMFARLFDKKN